MTSPNKEAQKEDYLRSLPEGTDYHSRVVREGLWRQQGCEGQSRLIDSQLQDERDEGLDKATKRWEEVKNANETIVSELYTRMGIQTLPPVDDPTGIIMKYPSHTESKSEKDVERQLINNQQLEQDVESHESKTLRQHHFFADSANEPGREIVARNVEALEIFEQHRAGWTAIPPQVSRAELYELANLQLLWQQIQALHTRLSDKPGTDLYYMRLVQNLCAGTGEAKKIVEGLQKCTEETSRVAPYVSAALEFFTMSGKDMHDVPQLLKMLRKSDPLLDRLRGDADRKYAERAKFLNEREDFVQAERIHNEIDDILEELVDVHAERLGILEGAGQDDGFLDDIHVLGDNLKELVVKENEESKKIIAFGDVCDADIKRLENLVREVQDRQADEVRRSEIQRADLERRIHENAELQAAKFESLVELHKEILELAENRKRLVDELVRQKEKSEERRVAQENVPELAAMHIQMLKDLKAILPRLEPTLSETPCYVDSTVSAIENKVQRARADTSHYLLAEQRAFYKVFHEFYMCCGELVYIRERRLEEIESQIDDLRWRIEIGPKVQDPNLKDYRNRVHSLEERRVELTGQIKDLTQRMQNAASEAAPVEEVLSEIGDDIVSPVIQLQERNVRMQQELLQARRAAIERKGDTVDNQEEEMARVEQKASVAKRSGALTQHMLPQSAVQSPRSPENKRALSEKRKKRYVERLRHEVDGGKIG